jgi:excisionase family DNA binding protein
VGTPGRSENRQRRASVGNINVWSVTEPWVSADVIAKPLGVTKDSVYAWIAKKDMPAHRFGRLWRFKVPEVDEWRREDADDTAKPSRKEGR